MKSITVYTPAELKESFPDAFEYAHKKWAESQDEIFWADEIMDSMKGLFKEAGIHLYDWSIGAYNPENRVRFSLRMEYEDLQGMAANAWIKANILNDAKFKRVKYNKKHGGKGWRYDITKKNGEAWSCEFTGYCADHDFIESLLDDIKHGCTLKDALHNLADTAGKLFEQELEYQVSEEEFLMQDHLEFTEDGRMV